MITGTRLIRVGLAVAALAFSAIAPARAQSDPDQIDRLAALGRLWGVVKYFHPALAYKAVDWDAALVAALPKVRAAKNVDDYRAAVTGMLDALGDPATGILGVPPANIRPTTSSKPPYRLVDDIVVLNCVRNAEILAQGNTEAIINARVPQAVSARAKGVVIDCRIADDDPDPRGYYFRLLQWLPRTVAAWTSGPLPLGTHRQREHQGYPPQVGISSGGYASSLTTVQPKRLEGNRAQPVPLAFVINDDSPDFRDILTGLQTANTGTVISESAQPSTGDADPNPYAIAMPGGFFVGVRIVEFVSARGDLGMKPDIVVAPSANDAAMQAALDALARPPNRGPAVPAPGALPLSAHDASYPRMRFPDADYRLLALFRFWNVINYFFPYRELMDEDWSDALAAFIPRFEAAKDELEYQMAVVALAKRIQDSHVHVSGARAVAQTLGSQFPPILVGSAEGQTVITALTDAAAAQAGLAVGDIVEAVDDEPVEQHRRYLERFFVASTPQAMRHITDAMLLVGSKDKPVRLRVRGRDDAAREVVLARGDSSTYGFPLPRSTPVYATLPSGYGYIDLARLAYNEADVALDAVLDTPALIFDMRGYPNGTGFVIAQRLLAGDKAVVGALFRRKFWQGSYLGDGDYQRGPDFAFAQPVRPSAQPRYGGKVVMLINEQAISQAEHTCLMFAAATQVTFIGSPTMGANGDVTTLVLPGGLVVSFTGHDVRWPDGRQLQRVGVQPDIAAVPTIAGIRAGRDDVLDAAVKHLQETLPH